MPGSFFKQDHLLSLIILRAYAKRWPKCTTYFKTETDVAENLIDFFFLTLTVRRSYHWKDFRGKKIGDTSLLSEETEALHAELNERVEAATSSYSAAVNFLQYIYSVLVAKNR